MVNHFYLCLITLILLTVSVFAASNHATEFFVCATTGEDTNTGNIESPFKSVSRAKSKIRTLTQAGLHSDVIVSLREGVYYLEEPLIYSTLDGGNDLYSVTYRSYPGEHAVISGGIQLLNWANYKADIWMADLSDAGQGQLWFRQLWRDGKRSLRSRYPNAGEMFTIEDLSEDLKTITMSEGLSIEDPFNSFTEVITLHSWSSARARVSTQHENVVTTYGVAGSKSYHAYQPQIGQPIYLEHHYDFIGQAEEWFLDKSEGVLYYQMPSGENPNNSVFIAPRLENLVTIEGSSENRVKNLNFDGISFEHSKWDYPEFGFAGTGMKAIYDLTDENGELIHKQILPAALVVKHAENCIFLNCRISHIASIGLAFGVGAKNCHVIGCEISDIGANGIMTGWRTGGDPVTDILIHNNYIHHCAQEWFGCSAISENFAEHSIFSNNEVAYTSQSGIALGFVATNGDPYVQKGCVVKRNYVHNTMQVLMDGAGIYTIGNHQGAVIDNNIVFDVHPGWNKGNSTYHGFLRDLRLYDTCLDELAIHDIVNGHHPETPTLDGGLVGWWKFDEGSGSTVYDYSGNDWTATVTGYNHTWHPEGGIYINPSTTTGYVDIPGIDLSDDGNSLDAVTIAFWAKGDPGHNNDVAILWGLGGPTGNEDVLKGYFPWHNTGMDAYQYQVQYVGPEGQEQAVYNSTLQESRDGQWHHWVFQKDAIEGIMRVWLDGELVATRPGIKPIWPVNHLRFGCNGITRAYLNNALFFDNYSSNISVTNNIFYNTPLTDFIIRFSGGNFPVTPEDNNIVLENNHLDVSPEHWDSAQQEQAQNVGLEISISDFIVERDFNNSHVVMGRTQPWATVASAHLKESEKIIDFGYIDFKPNGFFTIIILRELTVSTLEKLILTLSTPDGYRTKSFFIDLDCPLIGDINEDGVVNFLDFAYIASNWLTDNSQEPSDAGLIGWWKFDEGRGNTVYDHFGNDWTATVVGTGPYTWDPEGGIYIDQHATANYVNIPNIDISDDGGNFDAFTIAFWAKGDVGPTNTVTILWSYGGPTGTQNPLKGYFPFYNAGANAYQYQMQSIGPDGTQTGPYNSTLQESRDGQWHHWVFQKDAQLGLTRVFVDGVLKGSRTGTTGAIWPITDLRFGGNGSVSSAYRGYLKDLRIYNYFLDETAIGEVMAGGNPGINNGCVDYLPSDLNMDCYINKDDLELLIKYWLND